MHPYFSLNQYVAHLKQKLAASVRQNFPDCACEDGEITLEKPPNLDLGEFAYPCFPLAKKLKKNPAQVAANLAQALTADDYILAAQAAGPYLNIRVRPDRFIRSVCESVMAQQENFGRNEIGKGQKALVEYSSPNTNKPLHIGHVRNNLIGMALSNLLEFSGFQVIKANLINDRGIHICKTMLAYQKWGEGKTPKSAGVKGDHMVGSFYVRFEEALKNERLQYAQQHNVDTGKFSKDYEKTLREKMRACQDAGEKQKLQKELQTIAQEEEQFDQDFLAHSELYTEAMDMLRAWEQGDKEVHALWKKMNNWVIEGFQETYATLGCRFDKLYFESGTYSLGRQHVADGLKKNVFYQKEDGSIWVSASKLQETSPGAFAGVPLKDKLLLRADGTSVYITQDIGTAILKYQDFAPEYSIYVVADEQNLHFKTLFAILKMLGFAWAERCYHLAYGMVILPHGMGKIKSREGTAVDADALIAEMVQRTKEIMQEGKVYVPAEKMDETALDIALAALKVFILQVSVEKNIQYDPRQTINFTGDTGPAIQYSHARICSMLSKAASDYNVVLEQLQSIDYGLLISAAEYALVREISDFPEMVQAAAKAYNVSLVANYLLSLTKAYAKVYAACTVLKAENEALRNARLMLAKATAQVIKNGMALLGVKVPESM